MSEPFRPTMTDLAAKVMANEALRQLANWSRGKLTITQVYAIRAWKGKAKDIAGVYGVTPSHVNSIRRKDSRAFA